MGDTGTHSFLKDFPAAWLWDSGGNDVSWSQADGTASMFDLHVGGVVFNCCMGQIYSNYNWLTHLRL